MSKQEGESDMSLVSGQDNQQLQQLRELIFGLEYQQLISLKNRIENPQYRIDDIAEVLPLAVNKCASDGEDLSKELSTIVEQAIQESVRRDPQPLVDAIFPVLGPAIRKAIRTALDGLLESINRKIEEGLTVKSLKWRLDAMRTGKSYASYLVLKSMLYRVEQVFVIHKESGLLLSHVESSDALSNDPEMVSGMLTAVQDFVRDSFSADDTDNLQSMNFGDITVMLEAGPKAVIAFVVQGNPPASVRELQNTALERFHLRHAEHLETFNGDTEPYGASREFLSSCLISKRKDDAADQKKSASMWKLWLVLVLIFVALAYWMFTRYTEGQTWNDAIERLQAEPGLVVIDAARSSDSNTVRGLKDPMARDPKTIIAKSIEDLGETNFTFSGYMSLDEPIVVSRARDILKIPETVDVSYRDGILVLSGTADKSWIENTPSAGSVYGVKQLDKSQLAPDLSSVEAAAKKLFHVVSSFNFYFDVGVTNLSDNQKEQLVVLLGKMENLVKTNAQLGRLTRYLVKGHSDTDGSDITRQHVSELRAINVYNALIYHGAQQALIEHEGFGVTEYSETLSNNRRVSIEVMQEETDSLVRTRNF